MSVFFRPRRSPTFAPSPPLFSPHPPHTTQQPQPPLPPPWQDPSQTGYDSEPVEVIDLIGNATNSAKPTVQFFPDVRIGGKTLANPTAKAVIQAVCAATTGTKPAACSSEVLALMM